MFKIIIMALLIFIGMVGYDNITDKAQPTTPHTAGTAEGQQARKIRRYGAFHQPAASQGGMALART